MTRTELRLGLWALFAVAAFFAGLFLELRESEPWNSLARGMSEKKVIAIMGEPDAVLPTDRGAEWQYAEPHGIGLRFVDGVLVDPLGGKGIGPLNE